MRGVHFQNEIAHAILAFLIINMFLVEISPW